MTWGFFVRIKHLIVLNAILLASCGSDPQASAPIEADSNVESTQDRLEDFQSQVLNGSREAARLSKQLTDEANESANLYAQTVQIRLQKEQADLLERNALLYSAGAAGMRAQISDEEAARKRATDDLRRTQRILENALDLSKLSVVLLSAIDEFPTGKNLQPILDLDAEIAGKYVAMVPAIRSLGSRNAGDSQPQIDASLNAIRANVEKINALTGSKVQLHIDQTKKAQAAREQAPAMVKDGNSVPEAKPRAPAKPVSWRPFETRKMNEWVSENTQCRGGSGDDPQTDQSCENRENIMNELHGLGICYGMEDQAGAEMGFHRCQQNSLR
jgi:hypothetical protein